MSTECVFAWTATDGYKYYPTFLNISVVDGKIVVLSRGEEEEGKCGQIVAVSLPRDQLIELIPSIHKALQLTKD